MAARDIKNAIYPQFARIGHAVASPKRLELLDLLSQGQKTVETLAAQSATPIKSTSAHLRVLRQARLVETERDGTYVRYRLADEAVAGFLSTLQELGRRRLAEIREIATLYLEDPDEMEPVTLAELRGLLREGAVTVIDVRPQDEYEAGHIPGALSMPVPELKRRWREIPRRRAVVAYCRGPYCVYALEAVALLRKQGYQARRVREGFPEWKAAGFAVGPRKLAGASR